MQHADRLAGWRQCKVIVKLTMPINNRPNPERAFYFPSTPLAGWRSHLLGVCLRSSLMTAPCVLVEMKGVVNSGGVMKCNDSHQNPKVCCHLCLSSRWAIEPNGVTSMVKANLHSHTNDQWHPFYLSLSGFKKGVKMRLHVFFIWSLGGGGWLLAPHWEEWSCLHVI